MLTVLVIKGWIGTFTAAGVKATTIVASFLAVSAFLFPFSVAAANIFLALTLALGMFSGLWWQGAKQCWENYKLLSIGLCVYLSMVILGLCWSLDFQWGIHVLGRHWFWLLIPVAVAIAAEDKWRKVFFGSLSLGLTLNLVYCVLQMFGYVVLATDGSSAMDATGHIGHIGFGAVYGVWAAWLLHLGLLWHGWPRVGAWVLAAWSYVMIFSAQGRSGYLIAVVLIACVSLKWLYDSRNWRTVLPIVAGGLLIVWVVAVGPGKDRLEGTWLAFTQSVQDENLNQLESSDNAILATQARFQMWSVSLDVWRLYPWLGVGTGGVPKATAVLQTQTGLSSSVTFAHPHNQYLLNLMRWGPLGVLLLLVLWWLWIRQGLIMDWRYSLTAPLFTLSGLALIVHGLSSASMEEHFSTILAVLLLGAAMSEGSNASGKQ